MSAKWKTPIKCPKCNSTSVRKREVVYKSGTLHYSGRSLTRGISFGLSGKLMPRAWLGGGSQSGKRQSIKAQEAESFPFWPSFVIPVLVFLFKTEGEPFSGWAWFWFALSALLFLMAISDFFSYLNEWLCGKCGAKFVPELEKSDETKEPNKFIKETEMSKRKIPNSSNDSGVIDPNTIATDPSDDRYTVPRTWGVYRLLQPNSTSETNIRYGNHPIRLRELEREFGTVELVALYSDRELAKQRANNEKA